MEITENNLLHTTLESSGSTTRHLEKSSYDLKISGVALSTLSSGHAHGCPLKAFHNFVLRSLQKQDCYQP